MNKTASELPYSIELHKSASAMDMSAREEARSIMKKIYDEDPSYWPYGLDIPGHESLYLIRDNMTKAAAGFVGWQEMVEDGKLVGSYSIGILPEYRNKGFAKEAVAKVLRIKSAAVDEVRAYVMKHNAPSHALADSLGVTIKENF
jgi:RimJ/RimL family protein N-acetyltransferase